MREMKDSGVEWIGQIPVSWGNSKIKYLFNSGKGLSITKENLVESGLAVISYGQIHSKTNTGTDIKDDLIRYVKEEYQYYYPNCRVYKNDFIFADTSEDYDGCGNCVYKRDDTMLFAGYHSIILHSRVDRDNRYLAYLFKTDCWRKQIRETASGVKLFSVTQKKLINSSVILPPNEEQEKIADFLDKKCSEIDTLTSDIQKQIDTLEQYKKSVITEAVTKGLNPDAKMKDSGVEWIGQIPNDWEKTKIKTVCSFVGSGTTPASNVVEYYDNGTIDWIQSGDIYGKNNIDEVKTKITTLALKSNTSLRIYKAPFIVMAMYGGSVGNTAISHIDACTNQACCCLRTNENTNLSYMYYWLLLCKEDFLIKAEGGGQPNISQDKIKNQWFLVSNYAEQKKIADFLDKKCSEIDTIISDKKKQLEVITEYKKSLIYEYVTGKKEVM